MKAAIVALAGAGLWLGGCVALSAPALTGAGAGSGGFAAGYFASPANDLAVFNAALKADAPLKAAWCVTHEPLPPAVEAYCQHIPTDATQVPVTFIFMLDAGMADH